MKTKLMFSFFALLTFMYSATIAQETMSVENLQTFDVQVNFYANVTNSCGGMTEVAHPNNPFQLNQGNGYFVEVEIDEFSGADRIARVEMIATGSPEIGVCANGGSGATSDLGTIGGNDYYISFEGSSTEVIVIDDEAHDD